jgi:hypothetical protein
MAKVGERTYDDGAFGCSALAASDCTFSVFLELGNSFNISQTRNRMEELTVSQSWEPWKVWPLSFFLPWMYREGSPPHDVLLVNLPWRHACGALGACEHRRHPMRGAGSCATQHVEHCVEGVVRVQLRVGKPSGRASERHTSYSN